MKKLFLISLLVLVVASLSAQEKGDMVISGSLSWASKSSKFKTDSESEVEKGTRNFTFIPEFHYFVADKLSVGLGLGYSLTKDPNDNTNTKNDDQLFDKTGLFLIQPVVSYYISLSEKFYYVPRFYVTYGTGQFKEELDGSKTEETDISAFNVGLSILSFEFKPSDRIGIRFSSGDLKYETATVKFDNDNKYIDRAFSLGFNLDATIGFNFYF